MYSEMYLDEMMLYQAVASNYLVGYYCIRCIYCCIENYLKI